MAGTGISTGTFGRLPRQAPDLSGAIASLLREAQAQYDNNFVDAWKNGGKVDGKGVTDTRLLQHMKSRLDGLAKDDPLYDEWQNRYTQYNFNIEESKMALKNKQGKLSDAGMAQFYKSWAGKPEVQKDSEFYRSLLSRSAQWNAAATARAAGNSARAKAEAHQKWVNGFYAGHVQGAETLEAGLLQIAKLYGAADQNAQHLDDINTNSAAYQKFLDVIDDGKSQDTNVQGLIDQYKALVKKTNPNFTWNQGNIDDLMARGVSGLDQLLKNSTGKDETNLWAGRKSNLAYAKTRVKQTEANNRIQVAGDDYATALDGCQGDPYCARNATKVLRDKLQAEVPNVVAGTGKNPAITATTQDDRTAAELVGTLEKLNNILAGKSNPVETPASAGQTQGKGTATAQLDIFDAGRGSNTPGGWLNGVGDRINADATKLDNGGWMTTRMLTNADGSPQIGGDGQPKWEHVVGDPKSPPPPGAVPIAGNQLFDDGTRTTVARPGETPGNQQRTPTTYVIPSNAQVNLQDAQGVTLDPKVVANGAVNFTAGGKPAQVPWVEMHGVIGPDGVARTLYRTGTGAADSPYLFHDTPPVVVGTPTDAAGNPIIKVTQGPPDKNGNPTLSSDITSFTNGVAARRQPTRPPSPGDLNPPYVLGTYSSSGATSTAQAIGQLFHANAADASTKADGYLNTFHQGILALPENNPDRLAGLRDFDQLNQTVNLYKAGERGSTLASDYGTSNAQSLTNQGYMGQLARQGITPQAYGMDEVKRRMQLLQGIDDAEKGLTGSNSVARSVGSPNYGFGGSLVGGPAGGPPRDFSQQQADLNAAKASVFNPQISVSGIKIPGMPPMMQPSSNTFLGNFFGGGPAVFPKPYAAPAPPVAGPQVTPPTPPPPVVPPPVVPPKVTAPTPPGVNTAPPYNPGYSATPSYLPPGAKPF